MSAMTSWTVAVLDDWNAKTLVLATALAVAVVAQVVIACIIKTQDEKLLAKWRKRELLCAEIGVLEAEVAVRELEAEGARIAEGFAEGDTEIAPRWDDVRDELMP